MYTKNDKKNDTLKNKNKQRKSLVTFITELYNHYKTKKNDRDNINRLFKRTTQSR